MDSREITDTLNSLIKLDFDAIEAYEAAIKRLDDDYIRSRMQEFADDHRRHTVELTAEVERLGGEPADGPGPMRMLTEGAVVMGGLGDDKGILKAMSANEAITNRSYDMALEKLQLNNEATQLVSRNREDERRHKEWIDAALASDNLQAFGQTARGTDRGMGHGRDMR